MIEFLLKVTFFFLFFFSLYGWGALLLYVSGERFYKTPFYASSVGMAFLIFIGGLLNGLNLAYSSSLNMLFFSGLSITIFLCIRFILHEKIHADVIQLKDVFLKDWILSLLNSISGLIICAILIFLLIHLLPSSNYNFHDDLQKYIPRPVKMLQTGTLGGNPFSIIGIDSLGAQEFLNAFSLNAADVAYLYAFDSIFCFTLCALVLFDVCKTLELKTSLAIIPVFALILINPQSVNISSLYSGTLLTITLILSLTSITKEITNPDKELAFNRILPAALIFTAIICLKITFIPFLCAYLILYFLISFYLNRQFKRLIVFFLYFALASFIFILPWILTHFDNFSAALLGRTLSGTDVSTAKSSALYGSSLSASFDNLMSIFSYSSLFYGSKSLSYTLCVGIILMIVAFSCIKAPLKKNGIFLPSIAGACLACAGIYFIFPLLFPADLSIRYILPMLIAVFTTAIVYLLTLFNSTYFTQINSRSSAIEKVIVLSCFIIPLIISGADFSNILSKRAVRIIMHHTTLSFPLGENNYYKTYNELMFSDRVKQFFTDIQNSVEEGSTILAWVSAPFHLDYARNQIFSIGDSSGLTSPWLNLPMGADTQTVKAFLLQKKIKYILWESKGYNMRTRQGYQRLAASSYVGRRVIGEHGLYLHEHLEKIVNSSKVLFGNGRIVLCEIGNQ
jgi:hypothetical protein